MSKGAVIDDIFRGVENNHKSGDIKIWQPFKLMVNGWTVKRQPGELKLISS